MKTLRLLLPAAMVFALSAALAEAAPDPGRVVANCGTRSYSFETIDPPFGTPGVDMLVQILWVNDSGAVSVQYQMPPDPNGLANMHGAVRRHGRWTSIDVPGAISSAGTMNNRGQILLTYQMLQDGAWQVALSGRHGLRVFPDLADYPGGMIGNGVNDLGQAAAVVIDALGSVHGFVGDREDYSILDYSDAVATVPMGLNDHGRAVGIYYLPDGSGHGFWYKDGEYRAIERPGCVFTAPAAINNSGAIVGLSVTAAGEYVGFLLERGRYTDIRVPDALGTNAYSINARGQIAGIYADSAGVVHGFLATPVREVQ